MSRVRSEFKSQTALFETPPKYDDQNVALFGLGFSERQIWFDSEGALNLRWEHA